MARRLILDTGMIIALKRGKIAPADAYLPTADADVTDVAAMTDVGSVRPHPGLERCTGVGGGCRA